jgi:phage terminase large subunit-like protein
MECLDVAAKGGRSWWVAPSYKMSEVGWRPLRRLAAQMPGTEVRKVDREIILPSGGSVTVRSADNPDSLRGEGLDFVVMDECAFMHEDTWTEALRPSLADRQGHALFISTPKGRNWFWRLYQMGQAEGDEWQSWKFTSYDNPHVPDSEIDAAKATLPERVFLQEFMAEFIEDAGGVFRNVMGCATAIEAEPVRNRQYIMGVDWGKSNDFTVLTVLDVETRSMVYIDRFNQIDYTVQLGRLTALHERYDCHAIIAESNSMGTPIIEQMHRQGLPVIPFTTTNSTKQVAIDALALAFERGDIEIIPDHVLINELQSYEMDRTPSGLVRYGAPDGMHDDTVMSLAFAWHGAHKRAVEQQTNPFYR